MAGVLLVILQIVAVVERDFLPGRDVAHGGDPDPAGVEYRLAIGRATMIDIPRGIPLEVAVQVEFLVQAKNVPILRFATAGRLRLGNFFAQIFQHPGSGEKSGLGKNALAMNPGRPDADAVIHTAAP